MEGMSVRWEMVAMTQSVGAGKCALEWGRAGNGPFHEAGGTPAVRGVSIS